MFSLIYPETEKATQEPQNMLVWKVDRYVLQATEFMFTQEICQSVRQCCSISGALVPQAFNSTPQQEVECFHVVSDLAVGYQLEPIVFSSHLLTFWQISTIKGMPN